MTISVTRALAEVKSLNDRIARANSGAFITVQTGGKHASGTPLQEVESNLKTALQSVRDLIARRAKLKAAIVASNAVAKVTVAGDEMTVAEAIERKSSISLYKALLQTLKNQRAQAISVVERTNSQVSQRLDQLIQTTVGKDRKISEEELKAIVDPFEAAHKAVLVDPSKLEQVIEQMEKSIADFEMEVDFALSEVNAITKITV